MWVFSRISIWILGWLWTSAPAGVFQWNTPAFSFTLFTVFSSHTDKKGKPLMQTSHKDVIWKKHENKTLWALQRRKDSVDGRNAFYAVFLYSNWKRNSYYDGRNTGKLAGLPLCSIREKEYGVTHFTELHRTLHKNFLIWRCQMDCTVFLLRLRYSALLHQPVIPERSIPCTMYFCAKRYRITSGSIIIIPQVFFIADS